MEQILGIVGLGLTEVAGFFYTKAQQGKAKDEAVNELRAITEDPNLTNDQKREQIMAEANASIEEMNAVNDRVQAARTDL